MNKIKTLIKKHEVEIYRGALAALSFALLVQTGKASFNKSMLNEYTVATHQLGLTDQIAAQHLKNCMEG